MNFKLTTKGHYVTEHGVFINHWNLQAGPAHTPYSEQDGPIITVDSDNPSAIESAATQWKMEQRIAEEHRRHNDPAYLREQVALLTGRLEPAEKQLALIKGLAFALNPISLLEAKYYPSEILLNIHAILHGYSSYKEMEKLQAKAAKIKATALAKELAAKKKAAIKEARKKAGSKDAIVYLAEWLEYVNGNGHAYKGSRVCKARRVSKITADVVITATGKVYINGMAKTKLNLTNYETGEVVRSDYDMSDL